MKKLDNPGNRNAWIQSQLKELKPGTSLLNVGAGECPYKQFCEHLTYVSQDINIYDGEGNNKGLQTGSWSFDQIDIRCDLLEIPEDRRFDAVLCTEVLEHVPDPVRCLEKMARLVEPDDGKLIITAPFNSLTHFAPYYYSTGFSEYFYRFHIERLGFRIQHLSFNCGFFDFMVQELGRVSSVHKQYLGKNIPFTTKSQQRFVENCCKESHLTTKLTKTTHPSCFRLGCTSSQLPRRTELVIRKQRRAISRC